MTTTFADWGITGHLWDSSQLEMVKMQASLQWSELIIKGMKALSRRTEEGILFQKNSKREGMHFDFCRL